jgi:C4-dicarboxylate-specific signal transduction histidine kinase
MASARTRELPPLPGGDDPHSKAIRSAYGMYFADEALSAVRHDILNRVTAVGALSFELRRYLEPTAGDVRDRLEDLNRQIGLMCESVSRRLAPPRSEPPPRCPVREVMARVAGLCQGPVELLSPSAAKLSAAIDPVQLGVALLCVMENAVEACLEHPAASVQLQVGTTGEGRIEIDVTDSGPGLEPQAELRAFDRFFTTKAGHAGLGLCVARTILVRWGGDLQVTNRPGESGTRATLAVPAAARRGRAEGE